MSSCYTGTLTAKCWKLTLPASSIKTDPILQGHTSFNCRGRIAAPMPECCPHMQRRIKEQAECVLSGIQYLKENNKNKSSIFKVFGMKTINSCLGVCISSVSLRFTSQYGQLPWYLMVNDLLLPQHLSFGPGHACPRVPCRRVAGARQGNARVQAPPRKDAIMDYFHASKAVAALGLLDEKSKGFEITVCLWVFFLKTTVCMLQ